MTLASPAGSSSFLGAPGEPAPDVLGGDHSHLVPGEDGVLRCGVAFLGLGFATPKWSVEETPVMPKGRYRVMRGVQPTVGTRGLDMSVPSRACSHPPANLDFSPPPGRRHDPQVPHVLRAAARRDRALRLQLRRSWTASPAGTRPALARVGGHGRRRARGRTRGCSRMISRGLRRTVALRPSWTRQHVLRHRQVCAAAVLHLEELPRLLRGHLGGSRARPPRWMTGSSTSRRRDPEDDKLVHGNAFATTNEAVGEHLRVARCGWGCTQRLDRSDDAEALVSDWTSEEREYLRTAVTKDALQTPFRDGTVRTSRSRWCASRRGSSDTAIQRGALRRWPDGHGDEG